jgi:hypothetical protein
MYLVQDIVAKISYQAFNIPGVIIHLILGFVGFFGGILVLVAQRNQKLTPDMKLVISLVCADIYFCSSVIVFDISNLAGGGWVFGATGCVVDGIIVMWSCFASVFTLLAITIERYRTVLLSKRVTNTQAHWMLVAIWGASLVIVFIPLVSNGFGTAYALNSGLLVCTFAWPEKLPAPVFMIALGLGTLLVATGVIVFVYTMIVLAYYEIQKKLKSSLNSGGISESQVADTSSTQLPVKKERYTDQEKKLIIKSAVLTGSFFFCWSPYVVKIVYEIATSKSIPPEWDIVCSMGALANSALNSYLLIFLDGRIKKGVFELFGSKD